MPHEGEFAHYEPLRRIVESERVRALLGNYRVRERADSESQGGLLKADVQATDWLPKWVLAIDGSYTEVDIRNGFPGAKAAYLAVASVMLDVGKMRELDKMRPANPKVFRTLEEVESLDCALPGANIVYINQTSAQSSLRKALFQVFETKAIDPDCESLLDTYEALLAYKPASIRPQQCPYDDCRMRSREYIQNIGEYQCGCELSRSLYSTDALRIYERMQEAGSNGAIYGEAMQVFERIWVIHLLRTLEAKELLRSVRKIAIVLDGPLAVFGQPAWISQAIRQELWRLNDLVNQQTGEDILLLGIEKTGLFVDHLAMLDQNERGEANNLPSGSAWLLTDEYIKKNIIFSDSTKPYGEDTYFGRKLFYKTKTGALITASLPFLREDHRDLIRAEISQFPRLADAMGLIDQLISSRYPNALVPLVSANAEASIPLHLGNRVLEEVARRLIAEG